MRKPTIVYGVCLVWLTVTLGCATFTKDDRACGRPAEPVALFNGKDFAGWEGNLKFFRIEDGAIVAGSLEKPIPHNEFLCTTRDFGDFELRLQVKGSQENVNGGIQVRSRRVPDDTEVSGYQVDTGTISTELMRSIPDFISEEVMREAGISDQPMACIWGALYDESRRNKFLAVGEQEELVKVVKPADWNDFVVRCEGKRIQIWVNGFRTVDYTEPDETIELTGIIGLQIHSGPPVEIYYRNIAIKKINKPADSGDPHSARTGSRRRKKLQVS